MIDAVSTKVAESSQNKEVIMAKGGSLKGERRGGRKAGTPNKVGAEVRVVGRKHGIDALETLVEISQDHAAPAASRVMAADRILDRAYGRVPQSEPGQDGDGVINIIVHGGMPND